VLSIQRFDLLVTKGFFLEIGVQEDLARAQTELAEVCRSDFDITNSKDIKG